MSKNERKWWWKVVKALLRRAEGDSNSMKERIWKEEEVVRWII